MGEPRGTHIGDDLPPEEAAAIDALVEQRAIPQWLLWMQAQEVFGSVRARAVRAGEPYWSASTHDLEVQRADWLTNAGEVWLDLEYSELPDLTVRVRVQPTAEAGPVSVTGLHLERAEEPVTARDLRALRLQSLLDTYLRSYADYLRSINEAPARATRPGRRGHSADVWRDRYALYQRHREERAYIRNMRLEFAERDRPSDATVRRWVRAIEQKLQTGELP